MAMAMALSRNALADAAVELLESLNVDTSGLCLRSSPLPSPFSEGVDGGIDSDGTIGRTIPTCRMTTGEGATSASASAAAEHPARHLLRRVLAGGIDANGGSGEGEGSEEGPRPIGSFSSREEAAAYYAWNAAGAICSIAFVALIAGMFLGLLTLDAMDLQIIQRVSIDENERRYASNLFPVVKNRHKLLVTLLILNAMAYEALPIFLDRLVPSWAAILLSTTLVLLFGEILPSAVFTGPKQLMLGSFVLPLVKLFLVLLYPLAHPLSLILDHVVYGSVDPDLHVPNEYDRAELAALVRIQYEDGIARRKLQRTAVGGLATYRDRKELDAKAKDVSWGALKREIVEAVKERSEQQNESSHPVTTIDEGDVEGAVEQLNPPLHKTEVELVTGALQMKTRVAMDVYTPLRQLYCVPDDLVLDKATISAIYAQGWSRIPVYSRNVQDPNDRTTILGYFMARNLIMIDWDDKREVSTLPLHRPLAVSPKINLVDLLQALQGTKLPPKSRPSTRGGPLAFVCARPDVANKALEVEGTIPVHAGFMGVVTLDDIMESILQDRIYDEADIRARDRAIATLQKWAALKLQKFVRKRRGSVSEKSSQGTSPTSLAHTDQQQNESSAVSESTPLLHGQQNESYNHQP